MKFQDKYISVVENTINPDPKKTEISTESFAIGEIIQVLVDKIEHLRVSKNG